MSVTMIEVPSSNLEKVGYDAARHELHVVFTASLDKTYVYSGVSSQLFHQLLAAQSRGKFFAAEIRDKFPHRLL